MKYLCEVTWEQKGHKPLSGPSKTPCGAQRYAGVLCQMEMPSSAVVGRFIGVLNSLLSLPGVIASLRNGSQYLDKVLQLLVPAFQMTMKDGGKCYH